MMNTVAVVMSATAMLAVPGVSLAAHGFADGPTATASSASVERTLAEQKCRDDAYHDRAEFRLEYGGGKDATQRCIRREIRKAQFDCREKAREDPSDFRKDYGTGPAATDRCVRDELS